MTGKANRENNIESELSELLTTIKHKLGEGNAEDYDIEYDPDAEFVIRATPKQARGLRLSSDVAKVRELLDSKGATIEEALLVFERLGHHIYKAKIAYGVQDYSEMDPEQVDGQYDPYNLSSYEPEIVTHYFTPNHVKAAELELRQQSKDWLEEKIIKEIEHLSLHDKKAELTRRLDRVDEIPFGQGGDRLEAALKSVQKSVKREMEIEIERITDAKRLGWQSGHMGNAEDTHKQPDPAKREVTVESTGDGICPKCGNGESDPEQLRRRVVILLIEELIPKFPELIPAKQAEFLSLLTGRSKKGFELILPDHRFASNLDQTQRMASEWLDKLK